MSRTFVEQIIEKTAEQISEKQQRTWKRKEHEWKIMETSWKHNRKIRGKLDMNQETRGNHMDYGKTIRKLIDKFIE